ncbi:hypothetical protein [Streptomyces violascens]|uniref:Uncharacterized protein n=1 Tax=Streptomyces violascens TaxID=67381 RepID=A0ABQ3QWG2_9ACTN|nr:hypothetical protein [Streptomyces violascens]GHI41593.1 hypothetical protein Sviol_60010 [Streptomyces violascens]
MADQHPVRDQFWDDPWESKGERMAADREVEHARRVALAGGCGLASVIVVAALATAVLVFVVVMVLAYAWMTGVA